MSSTTNKIRQIFNLFLLLLFVTTITGVFVWLLTKPEDRGTTFWLSMGFLGFAALMATLVASRIALRTNRGADILHGFSHLYLLVLYFVFVAGISIANIWVSFPVTTYVLIHVGGIGVFLTPVLMINMAMLRLSGDDRTAVRQRAFVLKDYALQAEAMARELKGDEKNANDLRTSLKLLAESLTYADPTPGPDESEGRLLQAMDQLNHAFQDMKATAENGETSALTKIQEACNFAEQALEARNEGVLRAK